MTSGSFYGHLASPTNNKPTDDDEKQATSQAQTLYGHSSSFTLAMRR
jgi:hypothetical protein